MAHTAVSETHSGIVFFVGDRAYKLKKPLDLGFLDFRDRAARERICHREVELNRRLAPDVYLGVADVVGVDGQLCEHLVVMRRLPEDRRLSSMIEAGEDVGSHLLDTARLIADFHARAETRPDAEAVAGVEVLAGRWEDNHGAMAPAFGSLLDADLAAATLDLALRFLDGRRDLISGRIAAGRTVDGHGDLLADDIFCLDDGPRVLDCLEFDDDLRYGDVVGDVAFLAMDLERLGRPDLATVFLDEYQARSGAGWPASLLHHHVAYRAQVRAKVACIRAAQGDAAAAGQAPALLALAHRHVEAGRVRLILVGGLPGTGKSTVAAGLAARLGAPGLRSDEIRKELLGVDRSSRATASYGTGAYDAATTAATYDAMLGRAAALLRGGESVVLDATWMDAGLRQRAGAVALDTVADLTEIRCVLPPDVAADRMRARLSDGQDPSDATPEIAATMAEADDGWRGDLVIDTSGPPEEVLRVAWDRLCGHPGAGRHRDA
ncbi:MAG: AAA family ATPase [Microbacteriaceae bacterium]